ncbi:MAG: DUF3857 domain-containing protein [Lentisphaerae bacterium]|nr:DUF3857 domain-containing protein [Lentisphaerota bacterium]
MSVLFRTIFFLLACFCLQASFSQSADGLLDMPRLRSVLSETTLEAYPDADDVMIDDYIQVRYEADGTSVTWDDTLVKVLTQKGRDDNRSIRLYFHAGYGTAEFIFVQVIKADGSVVSVDLAKQSQVMIDRSQMSSNIYDPQHKINQVNIPALEIGDAVRYYTCRKIFKARVPDTFSDFQVLEYTSPIRHASYEVNAPAELPLRSIVLKDEIPGTVSRAETNLPDGRLQYQWTIKDVPQAFREPAMPSLHTVVQRLLISTVPSWEDISRWYWKLCEPHLALTPDMKAKVAELIRGESESAGKIQAIFRFVSQEIRYMGLTLETEAPGYEPHDVSQTFENRHGVCRDKAALLAALLREAGLDAYPVLFYAGPKKDHEVPQPFFNHAVTAVRKANGQYLLMDSTDEHTKDLFPSYLADMSYLVAHPDGEALQTSPASPYTENLARIKTSGKIAANGDFTCESRIQLQGINDNAYRSMLLRRTPPERELFFATVLKGLVPGAELRRLEVLPADLQDTSRPLEVSLSFSAPEILIRNDDTAMLRLPRLSAVIGYVNFALEQAGLEKRRFPFKTQVACGVMEEGSYELDSAWGQALSLPKFIQIDNDCLRWQRELKFIRGILSFSNEFSLKTLEFSPAQYLELKQTLRSIEANNRKRPIFACLPDDSAPLPPSPAELVDAADAVVLSDSWDYELEDAQNWTLVRKVKKKILTYNGLKNNSELKLDYNPAWEEVRLDSASVRNDAQLQKISAEEQNLMDAAWVAAAPRYPGAKTLVISLPGVKLGSVIEYQYSKTVRGYPFFSVQLPFQGFDPVETRELRISLPQKFKLQWSVYQDGFLRQRDRLRGENIIHKSRSLGSREIHTWSCGPQPAVTRERDLPLPQAFLPTVVANLDGWDEYREQLQKALSFAAQGSKETRLLVQSIRQQTEERRLLAVRNHIERAVRRAGPAFTALPWYCMSPADTTWTDGYGHSADLAALYYSVLQELGYKPEFVLTTAAPQDPRMEKFSQRHPDPDNFSAVLVRVKTAAGDVWFNDLDQYSRLGSSSYHDCQAMLLRTGKFFRIELAPEARSRTRRVVTLNMMPGGAAEITLNNLFSGEDFAVRNKFYSQLPPEERRRHYQSLIAALSQSAQASSELNTDFDSYPGVERYTALVQDFATLEDDFCYFEFPFSLQGLLRLWGSERKEPYFLSGSRPQELEISIRLPSDYREMVLCPEDFRWQSPANDSWVRIRRQKTSSTGVLRFRLEAEISPEVFTVQDYPVLQELEKQLSHPANRTILLRKR